jgi:hypothetical protein
MDGAGEIQPIRLNSEARRAIPESAGLVPEKSDAAAVAQRTSARLRPSAYVPQQLTHNIDPRYLTRDI